ncbi:protein S40-1-like [Phaseolus vulgaris]
MADLTTMADLGVFLNQSWGVGGGAMEDKDLDEDVWSVEYQKDDSAQKTTRACKESCGSSSAWRLPAATRKIARANSNTPPSSDAPLLKGSSEPMDVPDWSKIYGKSCTKGSRDAGACNKGGDDEDDDMVPPHEWIARKLARSQISSFSVCEGMGRTLKGRDLSKVRNAILAKTGFIE